MVLSCGWFVCGLVFFWRGGGGENYSVTRLLIETFKVTLNKPG